MTYPVWHLAGVNSGLIVAVVSVLHVFVAQFAVGGGIWLVWMERRVRRENDPDLLFWLERHTRFFLLLTMVFGGISGVGIWFSISVVAPAATSMLIHNFVFFWAAEWTVFLLEIVSLLVYSLSWSLTREGRMRPGMHMAVGLVYAVSGYLSLVLINGIITFMLTPGQGLSTGNVWDAFFNPTYWPSLVSRTGICLILAGMFALLTASSIAARDARRMAVRLSSLWIILPLFLLLAGSAWYFAVLPPGRQAAILRRTSDIHPFLIGYGWTLPAVLLVGILAFVRAERLRGPLAVLVLCAGLALVGSFEWVRETARRPWMAEGLMYSNGITVEQVARAETEGAPAVSGWVRAVEFPEQGREGPGRGELLFTGQCGICHGLGEPKIDILPRVRRLTRQGLAAQLRGQGGRLDYMPPFAGDAADREALASWLESLASHRTSSFWGAQ